MECLGRYHVYTFVCSPRGARVTFDVAVVGCGPVGAFAANLLGKAGLRVVVLEREAEPYPLPRAVHLDHEMMRLFADVGLLSALEPLMLAADGHLHIGADGGVIRFLSAVGKPSPFSFANDYFIYQPELESELRAGLARFPTVTLRTGEAVVAVAQDDAQATLTLASGEEIATRFVIGCDGARSVVRRSLGVALDDLQFEEPWLVVDAEVDAPLHFPAFTGVPDGANLQRLSVMLCDPRRPTTVVPGRGRHRRWEFMLLPGEDDAAMMAPQVVADLIAPWVAGIPHRVIRAATYRFHGLVAEQWQVGRVFLAGDAAHQTPPFFGQGMCHGMRDVANLAWKLELVLREVAPPSLLSSYQPERDPHVRAVIGAAVEAGRYICELDPERAAARDTRLRATTGPRTAADLIPPLSNGVVLTGAGERAIQPMVGLPDGRSVRLDTVSGGGWLFLAREAVALSPDAEAVWARLGGTQLALCRDIVDVGGHCAAWFDKHTAIGAIVRPDFYTFALPQTAEEASAAIEQLGVMLGLQQAVAA